MAAQRFEQFPLSGAFVLSLQSADGGIKNGQRPATFEDRFRRYFVDRFQAISIFGGVDVDGKNLSITAAFLRTLPTFLVRNKLIEAAQQELSKATLFGISTFNSAALKQ